MTHPAGCSTPLPPSSAHGAAVDSATGEEIAELLLDLNASGQTLILVTHNPELAAKYAHRVVSIEDGRVVSDTDSGARR